jgi:pSer/pThr/pTyr-binding forkhead associated (FHA) protein
LAPAAAQPKPQAPPLQLVIVDDAGQQTVVPLPETIEISLGREQGNKIRLTQRDVSPRHARLGCQEGRCSIEDLDSDNGVRVGGQRIVKRAAVREEEIVHIGSYTLFVSRRVSPALPPARLVAGAQTFVLDRPVTTIGSAPDNVIVLRHPSVSLYHARIERSGDRYRLADLQSTTGVRVGGEDYYRVELVPGDQIQIGAVELRFGPAPGARP